MGGDHLMTTVDFLLSGKVYILLERELISYTVNKSHFFLFSHHNWKTGWTNLFVILFAMPHFI